MASMVYMIVYLFINFPSNYILQLDLKKGVTQTTQRKKQKINPALF